MFVKWWLDSISFFLVINICFFFTSAMLLLWMFWAQGSKHYLPFRLISRYRNERHHLRDYTSSDLNYNITVQLILSLIGVVYSQLQQPLEYATPTQYPSYLHTHKIDSQSSQFCSHKYCYYINKCCFFLQTDRKHLVLLRCCCSPTQKNCFGCRNHWALCSD